MNSGYQNVYHPHLGITQRIVKIDTPSQQGNPCPIPTHMVSPGQQTQRLQDHPPQMGHNSQPSSYNNPVGGCMSCPGGCSLCAPSHPTSQPSNPSRVPPQAPSMAPGSAVPPLNPQQPYHFGPHPSQYDASQGGPPVNHFSWSNLKPSGPQQAGPGSSGPPPAQYFTPALPPPGLFGLGPQDLSQVPPRAAPSHSFEQVHPHAAPVSGSNHVIPPHRPTSTPMQPLVRLPPHPAVYQAAAQQGDALHRDLPLPPAVPISAIPSPMAPSMPINLPIPSSKKAKKAEIESELSTKLGYLTIDRDVPPTPPTPPLTFVNSDVLHEMFKELTPLARQISPQCKPFDTTSNIKALAVASFKLSNPDDWTLSIRCHSGIIILII